MTIIVVTYIWKKRMRREREREADRQKGKREESYKKVS
jgi:hypothetical protein